MTAIVTRKTRICSADNFIESFSELSSDRYYLGIGRSANWENEPTPNVPKDNDATLIDAWNNLVAIKLVSAANVKAVIKASPWVSGDVYKAYDDLSVTMFPIVGVEITPVYVITSTGGIYKCIETPKNGALLLPSTSEPNNTGTAVFMTVDGYRWKYMGNTTLADYNNFATDEYHPVKPKLVIDDGSDQWLMQVGAVDGAIEYVEVSNGGTGYTDGAAVTAVSNTGSGWIGNIVAPTGVIERIDISDAGSGYRDCVLNLPATAGDVATVRPILSPIGGHGSNLREELDGIYVMVKALLESDEGGAFPVGDDFRQVFLIKNPMVSVEQGMKLVLTGYNTDAPLANGNIVKNTLNDQGTVVQWDAMSGVLYISGITTGFAAGQSLLDPDNNVIATIVEATDNSDLPATGTAYAGADVVYGSGELVYIENRQKIQRNTDQTEDVRLVIEF